MVGGVGGRQGRRSGKRRERGREVAVAVAAAVGGGKGSGLCGRARDRGGTGNEGRRGCCLCSGEGTRKGPL